MLYEKYRPEVYWWDIVEVTRRLTFSSLAQLTQGHDVMQLALFLLFAFGFLLLHATYQPYASPHLGRLAFWSQATIFLIILCALLIVTGTDLPEGLMLFLPLLPFIVAAIFGLYTMLEHACASERCARFRPAFLSRESRGDGGRPSTASRPEAEEPAAPANAGGAIKQPLPLAEAPPADQAGPSEERSYRAQYREYVMPGQQAPPTFTVDSRDQLV